MLTRPRHRSYGFIALRLVAGLIAVSAAGPGAGLAQDGSGVRRVQLERDTVVGGIHCAPTGRNYAEFFADGRLAECPLAATAVVGRYPLPVGTWVIFNPEGRLREAWLSRDTELDGHRCKGTGYRNWATAFHPSGALRMCFLAEPETIQGVPCRRGTFWGEITGRVAVVFHDNGRLASCGAARAVTVGDVRYRRWQRVRLDLYGRPILD